MDVGFIWQGIVNGWVGVFLFAVPAVGLALLFGVAKTANFAQGEFLMVGAYTIWLVYTVWGWPFPLALLAAIGVVAGIGLLAEVGIFRSMRGDLAATFMASTGLIYILQVIAGQLWGLGRSKPVTPPLEGSLELFGASVGWQRFIIIPAGLAMIGGLWLFLQRFRLGRALRAMSEDPEAALLQGIDVNKTALISMAISAGFAGVAGALLAPLYSVTPYMGVKFIMMVFIIVVVGGTGSVQGALLASVIFGFLHTIITTLYDSTIATIIAAAIMTVVLAFRPQGLLGREKI